MDEEPNWARHVLQIATLCEALNLERITTLEDRDGQTYTKRTDAYWCVLLGDYSISTPIIMFTVSTHGRLSMKIDIDPAQAHIIGGNYIERSDWLATS